MSINSPIQDSFNGGIFSPSLRGHVSAPRRSSAVSELQNMVPMIQGPATRRGGTRFVHEVKDSAKQTALLEFEFSVEQAFIIEMGDQYLRFIKDNAIVTLASQALTGATVADPVVVTYGGADTYANGDEVFIEGVSGMVEINQRSFIVANVNTGANTFELNDREGGGIDGTGYTTLTGSGTVAEIYEISTNYLDTDLFDADGHFEFRITQSNDVMYIAHQNYPLSTLIRTTDTSWAVAELPLTDGPYEDENTDDTNTITPSGTTGTITLTAVSTIFASTDVDRLVRFRDSANNWTWLKITVFTSGTVVTATVEGDDLATTTASSQWRLGLWSDTTSYPSVVWLHEGRLVASTDDRFDFTQINGFTSTTVDFTPTDPDGTVNADNAISRRLGANKSNDILWIADHEKALLVGTAAGEWVIRANTIGEALAPDTITHSRATRRGSAPTQAVTAGTAVLFIQRARRKLHEMGFNFEADGFRSPDLTLLAEDITNGVGGIVQMAYQQQPQSIVWIVRKDGVLLGFTYERGENVLGWHKHVMGGSFSTGAAIVEHVAVIPSADTSRDELWMIVKRTINSVTRRYIEYMTPLYDTSIAAEDAVHVDSSLAYNGAAATILYGLDHLEGETATILNEAKAQPTATVTSGTVTIPNDLTTTKAQVGLANTWKLQTLEIEVAGPGNTMQGKPKRIDRVIIRYLNTLGISISGDDVTYDNEEFTNFTDFGLATALFTGDVEHRWPGDYDRKGKIYLQHSGAFPVTIQAVMPRVVVSDR